MNYKLSAPKGYIANMLMRVSAYSETRDLIEARLLITPLDFDFPQYPIVDHLVTIENLKSLKEV